MDGAVTRDRENGGRVDEEYVAAAKEAFDILKKYEKELTTNEEGEKIVDIREDWDETLHGDVVAYGKGDLHLIQGGAEEYYDNGIVESDPNYHSDEELLSIIESLPVDENNGEETRPGGPGRSQTTTSIAQVSENVSQGLKSGFLLSHKEKVSSDPVAFSGTVVEHDQQRIKPALKMTQKEHRPVSKFKQRLQRR